MKKLVVLTTTYNHEKFIKEALDGFVMQKTNFPFEVIISDDGSTDKTRSIISKYAKKYPNIIKPVFNKKNLGAMGNFVNTASMAKAEYVALCDGDDYWIDENKLQKQVDFLDANPDFSICYHQMKIFFDDNSKPEEIYPKEFRDVSNFEDLVKENFLPTNTVVYRWDFNGKTKLADIFPQDVVPGDYYLHLIHAKKGKIKFLNEVMSCYRRHEGGMWWLTSQPDKQEEFHLKYGMKYLNFFTRVEKDFNLPKDTYINQKNWLAYNNMRAYLNNHKYEELINFKEAYPELFELYIKEFKYDRAYDSLPKFKKFIYLLLFDNAKLKTKIKERIMRKNYYK